ncbi:MAG: ferritin-like domain-containing protein [Candidatus Asgardarchaeia archaeon]
MKDAKKLLSEVIRRELMLFYNYTVQSIKFRGLGNEGLKSLLRECASIDLKHFSTLLERMDFLDFDLEELGDLTIKLKEFKDVRGALVKDLEEEERLIHLYKRLCNVALRSSEFGLFWVFSKILSEEEEKSNKISNVIDSLEVV